MTSLCINIDNGPEWELAKQEFERIGIEVERFPAIVEDNRVLAFNKSVYAALQLMPDGGWLFEDDVQFDGALEEVKAALRIMPSDMLTFHLGCNIIGSDLTTWKMPEFYGPGLVRLWNCWQTHANYYSAECVKFILENFPYVTDDYKTEGCIIFDEWLRNNVLSQGKSYLLNPMIAYQRPRHSAIWNVESNYTGAHKQGNQYLKENV